jgi:hypothetical protein
VVPLTSPHDYVVLFALAALFGAIGGIAYELTLTRRKKTGALQFPSLDRWHYLQLGFLSSMLLGAVAAVAISYFFTPEVEVKSVVGGAAVIQTKWQIVKVIPLSLIVGSSGGAFLEAMRGRLLGELNAQKVATTQAAGKAAVKGVGRIAKAAAAGQPGHAAPQIASRATTPLMAASVEIPEDVRAELLKLAPHLGEAVTRQRPIEEHVEAVNAAAQDVLSTSAAEMSSLIDASVSSAYDLIDAAADA